MARADGIVLKGPIEGRFAEILTPAALAFVADLQRELGTTRGALLRRRSERQAALDAGGRLDFLPETRGIREGAWTVAPAPKDLQRRWVELTGPAERKMVINALNSGADVFMADFEDANTPTWHNMVQGQVNLVDAIGRTIEHQNPDGRVYRLNDVVATLLVRPRGWHLSERHLLVDGAVVSGSLFDFGLYIFHNGRRLLERGSGPYFYLPKLESHLEARLWKDAFVLAEDRLGLPRGAIRATVLVETIPAAFEMDEILWELRDHSGGLNAGRWDYMFSLIKKLRARPEFVLPDRAQVTMTVPFMRAYTGSPREDLPPPRGPRARRHGGLHSQPARCAGQRGGAGAGAGGQGPRVQGRLRRDVGGPSGPRDGGPRAVRAASRGPPSPARAATPGGDGRPARAS